MLEQTLFQESILRWTTENAQAGALRWNAMAELGWIGMTISEEYEGSGLGFVEACILAQRLGLGRPSFAYRVRRDWMLFI
jgi:alkylation response protein AidB-like acyl-CoA dehydrogenase